MGVDMKMEEIVMKYCVSGESVWGGAVSFYLSEYGKLTLSESSLSYCRANNDIPPSYLSTLMKENVIYGHGGFIFIDYPQEIEGEADVLGLLFERDVFQNNDTSYGKDIYRSSGRDLY
jgi:hypothetical protein